MGMELSYSGAQRGTWYVLCLLWFHRLKLAVLVRGCLVLQKCLGTMQKAALNRYLINTQ